jgi:hypothetical protein
LVHWEALNACSQPIKARELTQLQHVDVWFTIERWESPVLQYLLVDDLDDFVESQTPKPSDARLASE